jgi:hypothetical protein
MTHLTHPASLLLTAALLAATVSDTSAQQPGRGSAARFSVDAQPSARIDGLTAAQTSAWNATVRRISAIFEAHPAVHAPPESICTRVSSGPGYVVPGPRASGSIMLHLPLTDGGGACMRTTTSGVEISMNDPAALPLGSPQNPNDAPSQHFFALPRQLESTGSVARFRDTYSRWIVLTRAAQPLTLPLTREEYLSALIRAQERMGAQVAANSAGPGSGAFAVDFDHWLRVEKPKIAAEMRQVLKAAEEHLTAAQIREMQAHNERSLAELEAAMREVAGVKTDFGAIRSELDAEAIRRTRDELAQLRAMLDASTPQERQAPACIDAHVLEVTRFIGCGEQGARRMVRINPRYFDGSLPPTAIQVVVIRTNNERHTMEDPRRADFRWNVFDTLDYGRLAAELHP